MVVHIQTSDDAVDDFLNLIRDLAAEKQKVGYVRQQTSFWTGGVYKDPYIRKTVRASA